MNIQRGALWIKDYLDFRRVVDIHVDTTMEGAKLIGELPPELNLNATTLHNIFSFHLGGLIKDLVVSIHDGTPRKITTEFTHRLDDV
jgi:hypothetical protein